MKIMPNKWEKVGQEEEQELVDQVSITMMEPIQQDIPMQIQHLELEEEEVEGDQEEDPVEEEMVQVMDLGMDQEEMVRAMVQGEMDLAMDLGMVLAHNHKSTSQL